MPKIKLVEILEPTRKAWRALPPGKRQGLLSNPWVTRIENDKIFILPNIQFDDSPDDNEAWKDIHNRSPFQQLDRELRDQLKRVLKHDSVSLHYIEEEGPDEDKFVAACHDFTRFKTVKFGSPVAELDKDLAQYFVSTRSFEKARDGETTILIGPKGSGKSAILRELVTHNDEEYCIVITPEVFATSQLAQFDLSYSLRPSKNRGL